MLDFVFFESDFLMLFGMPEPLKGSKALPNQLHQSVGRPTGLRRKKRKMIATKCLTPLQSLIPLVGLGDLRWYGGSASSRRILGLPIDTASEHPSKHLKLVVVSNLLCRGWIFQGCILYRVFEGWLFPVQVQGNLYEV